MDWIVPESFLLRMKSNSVGISQCLKNKQDRLKVGTPYNSFLNKVLIL